MSDIASPQQQPCDVGVIFALPIEAGGFEDCLSGVLSIHAQPTVLKQGGLQGRHIIVAVSGPGQQAAARATEVLILGHRPRWIISAGFAGGLRDGIGRGDFILPNTLLNLAGEQQTIDFKLDPAALLDRQDLHVGPLLTADRIVCSPRGKRELGERFAAVAVDMETFAVGDVCRRMQTGCMAARIVSDAVDDELPADIEHLLNQSTRVGKLGAVAGALFRRPGSVKDMWKLREQAITASDRLAKFLVGMIVQLSPQGRMAE